jgi:hypothetical protein
MAHIEEGVLQAYLDDEVGARAEIDAHVHGCATCAAELERLRSASQLFASAIQSGDTRAPVLSALAAVKRANPVRTQPVITQPARRFARVPLARAAMLLFGFAAAASATIPGSPVRAWVGDALRSVGVLQQEEPVAPVVPDTPASAGAVEQGDDAAALYIEPIDGRIRIVLTNVSDDANVRVQIIEGNRALVQATGAAAKARFRTAPGRIEMIGVGSGDVVIDMPASVKDASVVADGRVLYVKQ